MNEMTYTEIWVRAIIKIFDMTFVPLVILLLAVTMMVACFNAGQKYALGGHVVYHDLKGNPYVVINGLRYEVDE